MSRASKRSRYESVGSDEPDQNHAKIDVKTFIYFKGENESLGDVARANPTAFLNHLKYANGNIEITASNVKCIRHIVRITCTSKNERDRLLDVAKLAGIEVTATLPFAESKQNNMENRDDVFNTFRYVISGVPADISTDEVKDFADCNLVKRITRRENGMDVNTETCILTYDEELVLPVTLRYALLTYKVRKYTTNPMQCKHCFKYGHTAKHCRHTAVCSNCSSSSHATEQCKSTEQKCANCGGKQ